MTMPEKEKANELECEPEYCDECGEELDSCTCDDED
jgi:hypothetical protein